MPVFSFRSTPLPSLRAYTFFSLIVLVLAVLVSRHHSEGDPPTTDGNNTNDEESPEESNDDILGFPKWVWRWAIVCACHIGMRAASVLTGCCECGLLPPSLVGKASGESRLRRIEGRRTTGNDSFRV